MAYLPMINALVLLLAFAQAAGLFCVIGLRGPVLHREQVTAAEPASATLEDAAAPTAAAHEEAAAPTLVLATQPTTHVGAPPDGPASSLPAADAAPALASGAESPAAPRAPPRA